MRLPRLRPSSLSPLALVTVSGLICNIGLLAAPWFEGRLAQCLADILDGSATAAAMAILVLTYVLVTLVVQAARFIKRFYVRRFANNINRRMKGILYANLVRQSRAALEKEGAGELMTKAISDVDDCVEGMRKFTTEIFDTGVALLAGAMIIPAVYVFSGTEGMGAGPSLMFVSLPKVFAAMGKAGTFVGILFFVTAIFATLTSCISVLESITANCMEIFHSGRKKTVLVLAVIYLAASAIIALGYSIFYFEVQLPNGSAAQLLDIMDYVSNSVMMPFIALLSTILIGWIMTPELEGLSAAPETVSVSIDFLRFDNETGTYIVSAEGAGVVTNGEVNNTVLPAQTSAAGRKWKTLTFTVQDATNKTRIKIEAQTYNQTGYRINIDNIVVMAADKVEVTEKLPAPELEKIAYTPAETSIAFAWEGVKGATSYEASVAQQTRPDFKKTVETTDSNCEFADLEPGLYIFTVRALYAGNAEFNSDPTQKVVGTLGFAAEKLATPTELVSADVTSSGAKISWAEVSGAANYRVVVKTTSDGNEVSSAVVSATSYTASGLKAGTDYTVSVQALVGDGSVANEFDSDEATTQFVTTDPVPMIAPTARIYAKTHGLAVLEWELSAAALEQQPVGSTDTYDFRVKDAGGNVIRSIENFSKFNFTKYKYYRLVWGGLTPGATYTLELRRKSTANKEALLDSEWASASVTTDAAPDKSGYLLYKDFENLPGGGQPFYGAYGFSLGSTTDFSDPDKILITTGDANSIYCQGVKDNDSYFSAYLPEWDRADWKANSFNVGLAAGYMKFGGGSNPAWLTLPKLSSLSGATEIELEFDACPYYEPSTKGDMMAPSNTDITEYFGVTVSGATIVSVTGETSADAVISGGGTTVTLRNVLVDKMIEEGLKDTYRYTTHKVKITGVTADTRIKIYSALEDDDKNHRMWLDNLKVKKVN
ncbi:MAG: hypothetical protein EGR20_23510 [Alistipes onderdonkii]|nr:hypothetical protein [Alistipes onderdonkii]